ncbi:Short-chain dehydrogenase/reductase family protein [Mycena venus]|uniref:Short-chain dehydrogenase/reductase family protein n=1 Tax=Mycena venus TaxID=2733690 RepID=A0A8H6YRN1_9AGAR|nr:Short-chain dehydrogenase/reductase family protein [Mycena venus]
MPWSASRILFSRLFRVLTIYTLCIATIFALFFSIVFFVAPANADSVAALGGSVSIICHILLNDIMKRRLYAAVDMALILSETGVLSFHFYNTYLKLEDATNEIVLGFVALQLFTLALSILFRAASMWASPERLYKQRFEFFGGCIAPQAEKHSSYAPFGRSRWRPLMARSMWRPLVRGEALVIKILRTVILVLLALGFPYYAYYTYGLKLYGMTQSINVLCAQAFPKGFQIDKSAIAVGGTSGSIAAACTVNDSGNRDVVQQIGLPTSFITSSFVAECDQTWDDLNMDISIDFNATSADISTIAYVYVGEGDLTPTMPFIKPIALVPGSHIFASLGLTLRTFLSDSFVEQIGLKEPTAVGVNEINVVQPDPTPPSSGLSSATLRLVRVKRPDSGDTTPILLFRESRDPSVLDGLSTVGGFLSFINVAFVLLFGANVMYFMFGRRPLSALGILHIFQSSSLKRKWHEDFPTIRTEGGCPGSQEAGIVAFVRDRLVDLGDDDEDEFLFEKSHGDLKSGRDSIV